jgi:hypothetical protein
MALELVYTSAARGLRDGTSGFCTVAMTRGLPLTLVPRLEAVGGYRAPASGEAPVSLASWRLETPQGLVSVLARVAPAAPDHTNRTNKLATYLVLGPDEQCDAGPAWLLKHAPLRSEWSGAPMWIEQPVALPVAPPHGPVRCEAWQRACGDAGWAGVLASAFLRDMGRPAHIVYAPGTDALTLADEAARLLPPWARWRATFCTYFLQPVAGAPCCWRFCLEGTPAAEAARQAKGLVLDLTRPMDEAPDSRHVRGARTGVLEAAEGEEERARRNAEWGGSGAHGSSSATSARAASDASEGPRSDREAARDADGNEGAEGELLLEAEEAGRMESRVPDWARRARERAGMSGGSPAWRGDARGDSGTPTTPLWRRGPVIGMLGVAALVVGVLIIVVVATRGTGHPSSTGQAKGMRGEDLKWPEAAPGEPVAKVTVEGTAQPQGSPPTPPTAIPPATVNQPVTVAPPSTTPPTTQPAPPTQPPEPPAAVPTEPATTATDAPAAPASPVGERPVPWLTLPLSADRGGFSAVCTLPPELGVATARFVPPPHLQQLGLTEREGALAFPDGSGVATVQVVPPLLTVSLTTVGPKARSLAGSFRLKPETSEGEVAKRALQRVVIHLFNEAGELVARARVDAPQVLEPPEQSKPARLGMTTVEPSLVVRSFEVTTSGRTELGVAEVAQKGTVTLPGVNGSVLVAHDSPGWIHLTPPERPNTLATRRAELGDQIRLLNDRLNAERLLTKRMEGVRATPAQIERALIVVRDGLTDEERAVVRGTGKEERSLTDMQALFEVLPRFGLRCKQELTAAQKEMSELPDRMPAPARAGCVEIETQDGLTLLVVYPEGRPR